MKCAEYYNIRVVIPVIAILVVILILIGAIVSWKYPGLRPRMLLIYCVHLSVIIFWIQCFFSQFGNDHQFFNIGIYNHQTIVRLNWTNLFAHCTKRSKIAIFVNCHYFHLRKLFETERSHSPPRCCHQPRTGILCIHSHHYEEGLFSLPALASVVHQLLLYWNPQPCFCYLFTSLFCCSACQLAFTPAPSALQL